MFDVSSQSRCDSRSEMKYEKISSIRLPVERQKRLENVNIFHSKGLTLQTGSMVVCQVPFKTKDDSMAEREF